jgi:hypothetical protein
MSVTDSSSIYSDSESFSSNSNVESELTDIELTPYILGLATVTVYGYDRTLYGYLTGANRPVYVPYVAHLEASTVR